MIAAPTTAPAEVPITGSAPVRSMPASLRPFRMPASQAAPGDPAAPEHQGEAYGGWMIRTPQAIPAGIPFREVGLVRHHRLLGPADRVKVALNRRRVLADRAQDARFETRQTGSNSVPGPRPILSSEPSSCAIQCPPGGHRGSRGDHRFFEQHGANSPFQVVPGPLLNSGIVPRRPIYQYTHGTGTVRPISWKNQAWRSYQHTSIRECDGGTATVVQTVGHRFSSKRCPHGRVSGRRAGVSFVEAGFSPGAIGLVGGLLACH